MGKILITSALPYVNNIPHLGNLIGATLSADVFARHKRLMGDDVLYICGADDHGTATQTKAREENTTPEDLCQKYFHIHKNIYDWFHISFDVWGRTHTDTHAKIVQEIFLDLNNNGYIIEKDVDQLYDLQEKMFLADRFVQGTCPHCGSEGARGDQCDSCQKLINAPDLINPISTISGSKPELRTSTHLFIDLPKLKGELQPWVEKNKHNWSKNTQTVTQSWMQDLQPRAITRDLSWGVPVPLEGFVDKVFYVWFDAPIGYISITAHDRDDWEDWWKDPQVPLIQFMGKDNIVFHSVIFPATLLGTKKEWNLVNTLSTTEFLNMQHGKFSKSRGTGVFGEDCIDIEQEFSIGVDAWRYYLLANRPESSDTSFSFADLQSRVNTELIANYGNLVHRTLHFAHTKLAHCTPTKREHEFLVEIENLLVSAKEKLDHTQIRDSLKEIMHAAKVANQYFQHSAPWESLKDDPQLAGDDIYALLTAIKNISVALHPFLPATSEKVLDQLGVYDLSYSAIKEDISLDIFAKLPKPSPLFTKIEDETMQVLASRYEEEPINLDLRIAEVTQVKKHPNADKLYVLMLNLGEEQRQIVSGLVPYYTPKELEGKKIVIVANLEEKPLRGELSQGMLLAGEKDEVVGVLHAPDAKPGTQLQIGGKVQYSGTISFSEFVSYELEATPKKVTVNGKSVSGARILVDRNTYGPLR